VFGSLKLHHLLDLVRVCVLAQRGRSVRRVYVGEEQLLPKERVPFERDAEEVLNLGLVQSASGQGPGDRCQPWSGLRNLGPDLDEPLSLPEMVENGNVLA